MYVPAAITLRQIQTSKLTNKIGLYNEMPQAENEDTVWVNWFASTLLGCRSKLPGMNLERRSKLVEEQGGSGGGGHHLDLCNIRHFKEPFPLWLFSHRRCRTSRLAVWLGMRFASRLGKDLGEPGDTARRCWTARWIVPPEAQRVLGNPLGEYRAGSASLGPDLVGSITDQPAVRSDAIPQSNSSCLPRKSFPSWSQGEGEPEFARPFSSTFSRGFWNEHPWTPRKCWSSRAQRKYHKHACGRDGSVSAKPAAAEEGGEKRVPSSAARSRSACLGEPACRSLGAL